MMIYKNSFLVLLFGICFVSSVFAEDRALLIGIDEYPNLSKEYQLHGPVNDVSLIETSVLSALGYKSTQIKKLINADATRDNILDAFKSWLIKDARSGDRVFFYYSGHGARIKDQAPLDEGGEGNDGFDETLAPYDTTPDGNTYSRMILDDELKVLFHQLEKNKVEVQVVIDSCFSGSITRGINNKHDLKPLAKSISSPLLRRINTRGLKRQITEPVLIASTPLRTVWSAASNLQLAFVDPNEINSVFTGLFVKALKGTKGKNITNAELFHYISKGSEDFCERTPRCKNNQRELTPTLEIAQKKQLLAFVPSGFTLPPIDAAVSIFDFSDVSVKLREGSKIALGKNFRIDIKNNAKHSGQLIVLDHRADGTLVQLYPNKYKRDNFIKENGKFWVPKSKRDGFGIKASVKGNSEIIAIIIHDEVDLDSLYQHTKDLEIVPIEKPKDYLEELLQKLQKPWVDDVINRRVSYSAGKYSYTVY